MDSPTSSQNGQNGNANPQIDFSRLDVELGEAMMMHEGDQLVDGSELDQYLPPGGNQTQQPPFICYPVPSPGIWRNNSTTHEEDPNNNPRRRESTPQEMQYNFQEEQTGMLPKYHELQPSATIKTEHPPVYQAPQAYQPMLYYGDGTGGNVMNNTGAHFLPSYQYIHPRPPSSLFGSSSNPSTPENSWTNFV